MYNTIWNSFLENIKVSESHIENVACMYYLYMYIDYYCVYICISRQVASYVRIKYKYAHYLFTYTCQIIHGNHGLSLELLCLYCRVGTHDSLASWLFILKLHPLQFEPTKNDYNKI